MSDKRQDTNATFANTIAYENGVKVNFEERGITGYLTKRKTKSWVLISRPVCRDVSE